MSTIHLKNNEFVEQHNSILITHLSPIQHWKNQSDYKHCITWCQQNVKCACANLVMYDQNTYVCLFYNNTVFESSEFDTRQNVIFISKQERQCSEYCEDLAYLNVCGPCKCVSLCLSSFQYYCDCTEVRLEAMVDCTKPLFTEEGNVAALYNIRGKQGVLKAMCQQHHGTSSDDLWLTVLRRHNIDVGVKDFENGFGYAYQENYFVGLNDFTELLKKRHPRLTLRMNLMTKLDGHDFWVEFKLQVYKHSNDKLYVYSTNKRDFSCVNFDFGYSSLNLMLKHIFKKYHVVHNGWEYSRIMFTMRPQKPSIISIDDGFNVVKDQFVGFVPFIGKEFCISFEYKLMKSDAIHYFLVMKNIEISIEPDKNKFYFRFPGYIEFQRKSQPQHVLNWFKVYISRYMTNDGVWCIAIHFNDGKLFSKKIKYNDTLDDNESTIVLARKPISDTVTCKMRNFYVNGVKYA